MIGCIFGDQERTLVNSSRQRCNIVAIISGLKSRRGKLNTIEECKPSNQLGNLLHFNLRQPMFNKSLTDLRASGVYLAPLIIFIRYGSSNTGLLVSSVSLIGAVALHGLFRHVFGPGGPEENPLKSSTATQRFYSVVFAKGPPEKFPEEHFDMLRLSTEKQILTSRWRGVKILFILVCVFVWVYSVIESILGLFIFSIPDRLVVRILYFALLVWLLQMLIWRWFDAVYLEDMIEYETEDTEQAEEIEETSKITDSESASESKLPDNGYRYPDE